MTMFGILPWMIVLLQALAALVLFAAGVGAFLRLSGKSAVLIGCGLFVNCLALGLNVPLFTLQQIFFWPWTAWLLPVLLLVSLFGYLMMAVGFFLLPQKTN